MSQPLSASPVLYKTLLHTTLVMLVSWGPPANQAFPCSELFALCCVLCLKCFFSGSQAIGFSAFFLCPLTWFTLTELFPDHPSVKCPWLHWVSRYLSYFLFGIYHCLAVLCLSAGWLLSRLCPPLECKPHRSVNWLLCKFPFHALCVRVVIMYLESPLREVAKETWTVVHTQSEELFQGKNVLAPA